MVIAGGEAPWVSIVSIEDVESNAIASFESGESVLDDWFHRVGKNAAARGECSVHVCLDSSGMPAAFFTLSSTAINPGDIARSSCGGINGPIPSVLLGKMAVRKDLQNCSGCGTRVLHHAMKFTIESSQLVSARFLVVDALHPELVSWYSKRGFRSIPSNSNRLVCKVSSIRGICANLPDGYFIR